ncbi:MAG: F0F1 ATP synthase subunit alpha, partial [Acidimicrobiales bacterium]|nr:F0F1 ATP synthase subunit alpha [Acidimicrobiales bacterium]
VEEQVVVLYAGTNGYLDSVPVADVQRFEQELLDLFRTQRSGLLNDIKTTGKLDEEALKAALAEFVRDFAPTGGTADEPAAGATVEGDTAQAGGSAEGILPETEITRDDESDEA